MTKTYLFYFLICCIVLTTAGMSHAAPQLDQVYDTSLMNSMSSDVGGPDKAQTFTVGTTGKLVQIDLDMRKWVPSYMNGIPIPIKDLLFDIRTTVNDRPIENDSTTLASLVIPEASISTVRSFYSFDISPYDVSVTSGDKLAIVLRTSTDNKYIID